MLQKHHLQDLLEPVINNIGYEVVRIMTVGSENPTLQIMIDGKDEKDITIDDCVKVSRGLSEFLDENDPIDGQYSLEVSSPGLDRPLTRLKDFKRFEGFDVKAEMKTDIDGRKRFKGKLLGVDGDDNIKIEMEGEVYSLPFGEMNKAKILLTDELLKAFEQDLTDNLDDEE